MSTNQTRQVYPTDLNDNEWRVISPLLPKMNREGRPKGGRPRKHPWREILNAIFYVVFSVKNGCQWRALPHDFPPWKSIYHYFRLWRIDGTWEWLNTALCQEV
jgi:putative transposase